MALPVTRSFTGVTGAIPTADETAWAYNRNNSVTFNVDTNDMIHRSSNLDTAMHWTGDTFNSNHYSEVTLKGISTFGSGVGAGYGPAVCCDTSTTQKTMYRLVCDSHGWELMKFVNAAGTSLASSTSPTFADGDVVFLARSGSGFVMRKNGVAFGSPPTDTALSGGAAGVAHSSQTTESSAIGIASVTMGNFSYSVTSDSGSISLVGTAAVLRPGSTTYLRYGK